MIKRAKEYIQEHRFGCFIVICLIVAFIMTGVSLKLYQMSGAIQLDMSRPGYEKVRTQVEKVAEDKPFDSSGKLDDKAIDDFQSRINKYKKELDEVGDFDPTIISDDNLGIYDDQTESQSGQPSGQQTEQQPDQPAPQSTN